jgi:hypothetical protein
MRTDPVHLTYNAEIVLAHLSILRPSGHCRENKFSKEEVHCLLLKKSPIYFAVVSGNGNTTKKRLQKNKEKYI